MKTYEFQGAVSDQGTVVLPPEVASQIPAHQPLRVILVLADPEEDVAWSAMTAEQFLKGYDDHDAVYDSLSEG